MSRDHSDRSPVPTLWDTIQADAADDCFADEIAIDFPSVDQVMARVCDSFLGQPAEIGTLMTEVSVSTRDASRGVVVPIEVPLRGTCPGCGGRGETWTEPCHSCRGTGERLLHHPLQLSVPAGVADGARFRFRIRSPHAAPVRVEVRVAVRETAA
jgi:DnaJ-class molecular chaperone